MTARTTCRLCGAADLADVIDLGEHALAGQFPMAHESDPPKSPVQVVRCRPCGLVQLRHTVRPDALFTKYGYRSSVTQTMRAHLRAAATEAGKMLLGRDGEVVVAPRVLDIAGNDGCLLDGIGFGTGRRVCIDPCDVDTDPAYPGIERVRDFFPSKQLDRQKFDLVFTMACLYSQDDPVAFAQAVTRLLRPDGLWVVEVADKSAVLRNAAFDYFCSEHVTLLSAADMNEIAKRSKLKIVRAEENLCNGGSCRYYLTHLTSSAYQNPEWAARVGALWSHGFALAQDGDACARFAAQANKLADDLRLAANMAWAEERPVFLLGASTKAGTVLQFAGLDHRRIRAAADRDPRKIGRRMPGLDIPIMSEEAARRLALDRAPLWLTTLPFREEVLARERAAGTRGDILFFPALDRVAI